MLTTVQVVGCSTPLREWVPGPGILGELAVGVVATRSGRRMTGPRHPVPAARPPQAPASAASLPSWIAAENAAWSRSFWSAYAEANLVMACSNAPSVPR